MSWTEIKYETASEAVEAVSNIMIEAGAQGVAIEDALDLVNYEGTADSLVDKAELDFIQDGAYIKAYFSDQVFLPELLPQMQERIAKLPEYGLSLGANKWYYQEVEEDDWADAWKKYYQPVHISRFLTIVPSWLDYEPKFADERIIKLDPGMAFGTGDHPTTRLSLQALETILNGKETILDVGTGSGILSIASKAFNAGDVYAYDVDEVAVQRAKANIELNEYAKDIYVASNDLLTNINIKADVIVANILADIIMMLWQDAYALCKDNGYFIVSGIIDDKVAMILEAAQTTGFTCYQHLKLKDWNTFIFQKVVD